MERDEHTERLDRELERLEHEGDRLEEDIEEARGDWEAKQEDASVPGAQPDDSEDPGDEDGE